VKDFMHDWISLTGFPLLSVDVQPDNVQLSQERFFINPAHTKLDKQVWPVPLLSKKEELPNVLETNHQQFKLKNNGDFKLNKEQSGFYRVAYNATHLERLGELIKEGRLSPLDRLGLLNDLIECAKANKLDTVEVLHFLLNFTDEDDYAVWDVIAGVIGSIRLVMGDDELREDIKPFILALVSKQLKRLGWNRKQNDSYFDRLLRPIILGLAASADHPEILEKCQQIFKQIKHSEEVVPDLRSTPNRRSVKRGSDIDPDLRGIIFGTVARHGSKQEFNKLVKLHNSAQLSEEKVTLAAAITGFKQPELISLALDCIGNSDMVRLQDIAFWISYSFTNRYARQQSWHWLKSNWSWLKKNIGSDLSFYYLPIYSGRAFSDKSFLKEYKKFFESVMIPGLERSFSRGVEMIEWQSAWKQRDLREVKTFFKAQSKKLDIKLTPLT
jgi:aminopeptidase N